MSNKLDKILAEISAGELIDKITILEIKKIKIKDSAKLENVEKELLSLKSTLNKTIPDLSKIQSQIEALKSVNLELWSIENGKRLAEKNKNFGEKFIELARSVYKRNDERARIKLEINNILGSNIANIFGITLIAIFLNNEINYFSLLTIIDKWLFLLTSLIFFTIIMLRLAGKILSISLILCYLTYFSYLYI